MKKKWTIPCSKRGGVANFLLKMKLFLVFFWLGLMTVSAGTYSQEVKFNLNFKDATVKEVFAYIEDNSEFVLFYNEDNVDVNRKVSVDVKEKNVEYILNSIFDGTGNSYKIYDRQIVILAKGTTDVNSVPDQPTMQTQKRQIRGVITDSKGFPVPGATVVVEGTTRGVISDTDGTYTIDALKEDKLVFSFIGLETKVVAIGDRTTIDVVMTSKTEELDDVTVVAFAKQKKESVIASVSTIKPSELKVPSSNLTTAFAGRIAGLISYQQTGEPGQDNAQFFIRGVTNFGTGKKDPLILIDGVEMTTNDLSRITTDDIGSFSIMKDANATALYGARGANGVILVNTKEGREGKVKVQFRSEGSFSQPTESVDVVDPVSFMKYHNEAVITRTHPEGLYLTTRKRLPIRNEISILSAILPPTGKICFSTNILSTSAIT